MSALRKVRRVARRFLAVPRVRRRAAALADRLPALRDVANRALGAPPATTRRQVLDIRPGRMFWGDLQGRQLPILVVVAVGVAPGDGEQLAEEVEQAQLATGTFRPLIVTDSNQLAPFRLRGQAVEAVMAQSVYARINPQDAWSEYLFERVNSIVKAYGAQSVVPWTANGWQDTPRYVLRLLGALGR